MSSRFAAWLLAILAAASVLPALGANEYPEATDWSPTGNNVALEGPIRITWNMSMDPGSVEAAFFLTDGQTVWGSPAFQWVHATTPPWTSRATPLAPLKPSTDFAATVLATARDASGQHALDQDGDGVGGEPTDALVWTFQTENGTPRRVLSTTPVDGETDVAVTSPLTIAFDEPMLRDSVEAAWTVTPETAGAFEWGANDSAVRFAPSLLLYPGTRYDVVLEGGVAKDANGALLDGDGNGVGGDDFAFAFTTAPDLEPPKALAVAPAPGALNVSVTSRITVRFSEAMNRSSVEAAFSYANRSATWSGADGVFAWSGTTFPDDTATFNPDANLVFADAITVTLNGSLAADRAGDALDGNGDGMGGDDHAWSFVTEPVDARRPRIDLVDPSDGATGVPETTTIRIGFSEAMDRGTVEDAFLLQDPVRTWTRADGWFAWSRGDEQVTFSPSANLGYDSEHILTVGTTARDVNGNPLDGDGAGGNFTARFHTRPQPDVTPPRVVSTIPAGGDRGVNREARIVLTFDDTMDRQKTERAITVGAVTPYGPDPVAVGDFQWAAEDHAVSFQRLGGPWDWETTYVVSVSRAGEDRAGNPLAEAHSFTFVTEGWRGRVVGRVVAGGQPVAGATVRLGAQTTLTGANGTFEFPAAESGTYELIITRAGFETLRRTVTLDHRAASADLTTIDLGEFSLEPEEAPLVATIAGLGAAITGVLALGWFLRRRRRPPEAHLEDFAEETAEALR